MSSIYDRTVHTRRLVRRNLRRHIRPWPGLGACDEHFTLIPALRRLSRGPAFATPELAADWAFRTHPGQRFVVQPRWSTQVGQPQRREFVAWLVERTGPPFRERADTWAYQVAQRHHEEREMKRALARGGFQGGVKPHRRKYHKARRAAGKRAVLLAMQGELDAAGDVLLNVGTRGILWDVY